MQKTIVVTGGNRGIGLEICRQLAEQNYKVILTARNEEAGNNAVKNLGQQGLMVDFFPLDVSSDESRQALKTYIETNYGKLDALVNNAGIMPEKEAERNGIYFSDLDPDENIFRQTFDINALSPYMLTTKLWPLLKNSQNANVVNLSSEMGQLSRMSAGYAGYRISKTALNAVTCILAANGANLNIKVNSVCPGWTQTEMGGMGASRPVSKGAETVLKLLTENHEHTGKFFRDMEVLAW